MRCMKSFLANPFIQHVSTVLIKFRIHTQYNKGLQFHLPMCLPHASKSDILFPEASEALFGSTNCVMLSSVISTMTTLLKSILNISLQPSHLRAALRTCKHEIFITGSSVQWFRRGVYGNLLDGLVVFI